MRESFLHFIWQFQKFDNTLLTTQSGLQVQVFTIGNYNSDAGPDFLNAKLLIGDITWFGHVELHLKSSDWNRHRHQHDEAYNNVVLHVVCEHDEEVQMANGQKLPVIELQKRIKPELLNKCNELIRSPEKTPCATQIDRVKDIEVHSMLDQVGVMRLRQKSEFILDLLNKNNGNWEETTYQLLARNFGFKTNEDAFLKLSQSLSHKVLIKHTEKIEQMEAMVFGMAGFLQTDCDEYALMLQREFDFLSKKYKLKDLSLMKVEWKFLRLRPGNFPTVRLAQFAAFLAKNAKLFDQFIHFADSKTLRNMFEFEVSSYWKKHYDFGKGGKRVTKTIGKSSVDLILINSVAPLLAAYAQYTDDNSYMEKSVRLLQSLIPEKNYITRHWKELGIKAKDAFDSQALIGLRNDFCLKKKCLSCKIGVSLINN